MVRIIAPYPSSYFQRLAQVVVGGGPTSIELSGELHDFLGDDLKSRYPEPAGKIRITSGLPMFSKHLIDHTESAFKESKIIPTKTMAKEVKEKNVVLQIPDKSIAEVPCGMAVWTAGNKGRQITQDLMGKLPSVRTNRRGISVDDHLRMAARMTASSLSAAVPLLPTRPLHKSPRSRQGAESEEVTKEKEALSRQLEKLKLWPFRYSHRGSLVHRPDKATADLPFFNGNFANGGVATFLFWRSAYLSMLFSPHNCTLVATDWIKTKVFRRDVSCD
ncbi:hypothetical protein FIBSPDRAFT_956282 [Athelia psychrophila]|uniref:NADH:ubiquinone reductase (non-electrogenic) n=1 Tax=Athelia psychrophila TaxID=1759441 RepID=A0A166H5F5_9AGAM|nr:hypothetical protein FIBSPDRAFT_956282 [Fibularhizoctonia sp. CBS 109695]